MARRAAATCSPLGLTAEKSIPSSVSRGGVERLLVKPPQRRSKAGHDAANWSRLIAATAALWISKRLLDFATRSVSLPRLGLVVLWISVRWARFARRMLAEQ